MDLLIRRPASWNARTRGRVGAGAIVLLAAACTLLSQMEQEETLPRFDHALHAAKTNLDCDSCHREASTSADAGMPSTAQCSLCHKDLDKEKPPERQASVFFAGDAIVSARVTEIDEEVRFSHQAHAKHGVACADCHGDIASSHAVPASARVTMDACIACHTQRTGRAEECAACHQQIRIDRAPESHLREWTRRHGGVVRMAGGAKAADCTMCHTQERDCAGCHSVEAPADHTNYWRTRGHGISVRIDRDRCAACHQTDSCDRCHHDSAPRSHTASFGSPLDRHCNTCHLPLSSSGCATCHKSTPSHAQAPPMPPDHVAGMNCRQCHGLSVPLPHPDKGDSCTSCHK